VISKIKNLILRVLHVSRLTDVKSKKLRILISVFLANFAVVLDVLIIVIFSYLLTNNFGYENQLVQNFIYEVANSKILLPSVVFLRFTSLFFERFNLELLSLDIQKNIRKYIMKEVYKIGNFSIADTYYFVNDVTSNITSFYKSFAILLNSFVQALFYTLFLMFTDLSIFLYFIIGALIIAFPSKYLLKKGKEYQHITFNEGRSLSYLFQRIIENLFLIKILSTFNLELKRVTRNLDRFKKSQKMNIVFGGVNTILPTFFTIFTLAILFTNFEISTLVTLEFIAILLRLFQSIGNLNSGIGLVVNSSVHVEELYKLDANKPNIKFENYKIDSNIDSAVEINEVDFQYFNSNERIFDNLNLKIKRNSHTIITGPNGSGKSTILGLIAGLYIPTKGRVLISTEKIGYVGVTPLVFEASIKDNLLYGNNLSITDEDLIKVLNDFKFYNEGKYDLSQKISIKTLSSGQLQKISFMRTILSEAKLLLLDEATSNLDRESKKLIFDILSNRNITIVNSTHNKEDFSYNKHIEIQINNDSRIVKVH